MTINTTKPTIAEAGAGLVLELLLFALLVGVPLALVAFAAGALWCFATGYALASVLG